MIFLHLRMSPKGSFVGFIQLLRTHLSQKKSQIKPTFTFITSILQIKQSLRAKILVAFHFTP